MHGSFAAFADLWSCLYGDLPTDRFRVQLQKSQLDRNNEHRYRLNIAQDVEDSYIAALEPTHGHSAVAAQQLPYQFGMQLPSHS